MTEKQNTFEAQARENLTMSDKKMAAFLKEAAALRRNLKNRKKQQQERQNKCMRSK
ncbi:MAG: hypothetical protein IKS41_01920 [Alphaproteobacteria bacterium]|nr:hypothetical protein [Alphaproteobacteria bacterium]